MNRGLLPLLMKDPLDIPGSSLGVPSDTDPHAVRRIPWTSRDPLLMSPQTQAPMLSGGSPGHPGILPWCPLRHRPPCCPEDPLDIPGFRVFVYSHFSYSHFAYFRPVSGVSPTHKAMLVHFSAKTVLMYASDANFLPTGAA